MKLSTIAALAREVAPLIQSAFADAVKPILVRLQEIESRPPEKGEKGDPGDRGSDGKDGAPGANGRDGIAGKDGPPGERGLDGNDGVPGERGEKGDAGRDGKDGAAVEQVLAALLPSEEGLLSPLKNVVAEYFRAFPPPAGRDGMDGKDGAPGAAAEIRSCQTTSLIRYRRP
jgi:hypothetical protein